MSKNYKPALIILIVFLVFFTLGTGLPVLLSEFYRLSLREWSYQAPAQTTLFTSDGKVLMQFGYERVYKSDFPDLLEQAVVQMEDRRFYEHGSIDMRGMLRALWVDIKVGEKVQGGSTITQQLARTLFLNNKKSFMRKSKEIIIATALERKYSKDEILNMYLNEIYMGRGVSGMGAAAQKYFGQDVSTLSLAQISYLVAMISAPEYYSPDHNSEALRMRQATVLNVLIDSGKITQEEGTQALSKRIEVLPDKKKQLQHPYFTVYLLSQLKKDYGDDAIYRGGLQVYTTIDSRMQQIAERTVQSNAKKLHSQGITARDAALVSVEPGSGAIKALVGGSDFERNQVNMAMAPRQPGSAIKPLIYAAAMDLGRIDDRSIINNRPRSFNGYRPTNSTGNPDKASVRRAVAFSYNVAAVEVLNDLGLDKAIRYIQRFGVTSLTAGDAHLALALGGMEKGISPLEMAAAYAVFANEGVWAEPYAISRIEDGDGTVLYDHSTVTQKVLKARVAKAMDSILKDVMRYGTGSSARISIQAGGKTGTTSNSRDLWFVGYTSQLSTAVWLGNSNNDAIKGVATYGGTRCGPIWRDYMNSLIRQGLLTAGSREVDASVKPEEVDELEPDMAPVEEPSEPQLPLEPEPDTIPDDEATVEPEEPSETPSDQLPESPPAASPENVEMPAHPNAVPGYVRENAVPVPGTNGLKF